MEPKINARYEFGFNDVHRPNCIVREEPDTYGEVITLIVQMPATE